VVLTAAISEASDAGSISESLADLDAYFRSDEGRTLLSRTQEPESVTILETTTETDLFLLHARDTSAGAMQGVKEDYWRAYLDLGSRIATLSVLALEDRGVTREQSLASLRSFARTVRQANAQDASEEVAVADTPPSAVPEPRQRGGLFNIGLFRRIFD
jgi:hypothetical protein